MWWRKQRNVYLERKRKIRVRLFTVLGLLLLSVVAVGVWLKPQQQPLPTALPHPTYTSRFLEKMISRQGVHRLVHGIKPGDSFYQILVNLGVQPAEVGTVVAASKSRRELQKLRAGERLELFFSGDSKKLEKLRYEDMHGQVMAMSLSDLGWVTSRYTKPVVVTPALAQGTITDSLYQSAVDQGIDFQLALALADIFAWDIDFFVDLRPGDHYEFLYQRRFRDGKLIGNGRIIAAHFRNGSAHRRAYYYQAPGKKADYYDDQGNSLRKQFLKSPLRYSRISSGYSKRRLHPILKIYRPHPGIDYAAPSGTPVVAVGDGRVISRRWKNGYGRFIAVRHNNRYTTTYGHLSRYGAEVKVGATVKQGQVIGYVGASGLASGPHLDFRMKKNGHFVNPLKMRFPAARPVPKNHMSDFKQRITYLEEKLDRLLAKTESQSAPPAALAVYENP